MVAGGYCEEIRQDACLAVEAYIGWDTGRKLRKDGNRFTVRAGIRSRDDRSYEGGSFYMEDTNKI